MFDDRGGVRHQQVWSGGRGRERGATEISIFVSVCCFPGDSVFLVVFAVVVPVHDGLGVRWAGSEVRGVVLVLFEQTLSHHDLMA